LADRLAAEPDAPLAAALTPPRRLPFRQAVVGRDRAHAARLLREPDPSLVFTGNGGGSRSLVYLFPGVGEQYVGLGAAAYRHLPGFRAALDDCADHLRPHLGQDIRDVLYPDDDDRPAPAAGWVLRGDHPAPPLSATAVAQPLVFAVEYGLARLLQGWGLVPSALLGYSIGEYVAATVAGVLSLPDAARLVARRAALIDAAPAGAMTLVPLPPDGLAVHLSDEVCLAAVNGVRLCVASGPVPAIERLERALAAEGVATLRVPTRHAFHSSMMDGLEEPLRGLLATVTLRPPRLPFLSNVTGGWIGDREATDPGYWARHLSHTIRFTENVARLWRLPSVFGVETGPGQMLASLVNVHPDRPSGDAAVVVSPLSRLNSPHGELAALLSVPARAWVRGIEVDWPAVVVEGKEPAWTSP
jgi:acyl transferase domain-containing protein